jgi:hypothetical protein
MSLFPCRNRGVEDAEKKGKGRGKGRGSGVGGERKVSFEPFNLLEPALWNTGFVFVNVVVADDKAVTCGCDTLELLTINDIFHSEAVFFQVVNTSSDMESVRVGQRGFEAAVDGSKDRTYFFEALGIQNPCFLKVRQTDVFKVAKVHGVVDVLQRVHVAPENILGQDNGKGLQCRDAHLNLKKAGGARDDREKRRVQGLHLAVTLIRGSRNRK